MAIVKITLREIASKAGVAKSTASYALNNSYIKGINITEETRVRIKKIATEMGYVIDDMARAMSTGRTKVLGLVCSYDSIRDNFSPVLGSVMEAASKHDFFVKMLYQIIDSEDNFISTCVRQRLSAVLFYIPDEKTIQNIVLKLKENGIVPAIIGNSFTPEKCIHVKCDDKKGSIMMVNKLYDAGHRKIAYISTEPEYLPSSIRRDGYVEAMNNLSLDIFPEYVWGSKCPEKIRKHVFNLLTNPLIRPDAVYCSGDNIASVVIDSINEFGFRVPANISVAGFGNLSCSQYSIPQISTVDECHSKTSARIMKKILSELAGKKHVKYFETISPSLILRGSTSSKK